jgi:hypothetical protein
MGRIAAPAAVVAVMAVFGALTGSALANGTCQTTGQGYVCAGGSGGPGGGGGSVIMANPTTSFSIQGGFGGPGGGCGTRYSEGPGSPVSHGPGC